MAKSRSAHTRTFSIFLASVLALSALVAAPAAHAFDPDTITQNWELLPDAHNGIAADSVLAIERGVLPGGTSGFDPAPLASLEITARHTGGAPSSSWTVGLYDDQGTSLSSVVLSATAATFKVRTATLAWPATDRELTEIRLIRGGLAGSLDLRKASLRLIQDGTIAATQGRFPLATRTEGILAPDWSDIADAPHFVFPAHNTVENAPAYLPAPSVHLRAAGSPCGMRVRLVRSVDTDGDNVEDTVEPVARSEVELDNVGASKQSPPLRLVPREIYRAQAKLDVCAEANAGTGTITSADLIFAQSTEDPAGIKRTVGYYPSITDGINVDVTNSGLPLNYRFRSPAAVVDSTSQAFAIGAVRTSGSGAVSYSLYDHDAGGAVSFDGSATEHLVGGTGDMVTVRRIAALPAAGHELDTVINVGTGTARAWSSYLQVNMRLRDLDELLVQTSTPAFSPNGDGVKDTTTVEVFLHPDLESAGAQWTLSIKDAAGGVVREFIGTGGISQITWDGFDAAGQTSPDGAYAIAARVDIDPSTFEMIVKLDTGPPVLVALQPEQNGNTIFAEQKVGARFKTPEVHEATLDTTTLRVSFESMEHHGSAVSLDDTTGWARADVPAALTQPDDAYVYSAAVYLEDDAGNFTDHEWQFRRIQTPQFSAGVVSAEIDGEPVGEGSSTWSFAPHLELVGGSALWPTGSAHAGWGTIVAQVPLQTARILVTVDGVEEEWTIPPYAAGSERSVYTPVHYFEEPGTIEVTTDLPSTSVRLPTLEMVLPAEVDAARLMLDSGTSFHLAGVCADATPEDPACGPDPLRVFVSPSFARKFQEPRELGDDPVLDEIIDGPEMELGAPRVLVMQKLPDPLDPGGTWSAVRPFQYQSCPVWDGDGDAWCPLEDVLYPGDSPILPPALFDEFCRQTGFCSGQKFDSVTGEVDNKYECIHPADGRDLPPKCYFGECTGESSEVCEQMSAVTAEYVGAATKNGWQTHVVRVRMISDWGFEDGQYDMLGAHVSTRHRHVQWLPSPGYQKPFDGYSDVENTLYGGIYPQPGGETSDDALSIWTTCYVAANKHLFYGDWQDLPDAETHDEGNHAYGARTGANGSESPPDRRGFRQWEEIRSCAAGQQGSAYIRPQTAQFVGRFYATPCGNDVGCGTKGGWIVGTWIHTAKQFDVQGTIVRLVLNPFNACFGPRKWLCNKIGFIVTVLEGPVYKERHELHKVLVPNAFKLLI